MAESTVLCGNGQFFRSVCIRERYLSESVQLRLATRIASAQYTNALHCASRSCQLYRDHSVAEPQFQTGYGAAVQSQYRAPIARKHGADCGLRGLEEYAHSGRRIKPERDVSAGLLPDDYG